MPLPFFYTPELASDNQVIALNEETSKHIVQVLRMNVDEQIQLTDGKGKLCTATITEAHKKKCVVKVVNTTHHSQAQRKTAIAISLIKNANRFEWFLEKATELGINEIIPLICHRTEKQHFRYDRMKSILISAMLQSQQCWLPVLHEPVKLIDFVNGSTNSQKFIAHCEEDKTKKNLSAFKPLNNSIILIGPEGDFTAKEIQLALENSYVPVTLGNTRLRTETAGLAAAVVFTNISTS